MMNGLTNLETPTLPKSRMPQILGVAHEKWIQEKLIPYRGICFLIPQDDRGIQMVRPVYLTRWWENDSVH